MTAMAVRRRQWPHGYLPPIITSILYPLRKPALG